MTTLPAPEGYRNKGKNCYRMLSDAERLIVVKYAATAGAIKASEKFGVSTDAIVIWRRKFGIAALPPYRPQTYTDAEVEHWTKRALAHVKAGKTVNAAAAETAMYFSVGIRTVLHRVFKRQQLR